MVASKVHQIDLEDKLKYQISTAGQELKILRSFGTTCFLNTDLIRCKKVQFSGLFSGQENWFHPLQGVAFSLVY